MSELHEQRLCDFGSIVLDQFLSIIAETRMSHLQRASIAPLTAMGFL
jgi:hypothetical protein